MSTIKNKIGWLCLLLAFFYSHQSAAQGENLKRELGLSDEQIAHFKEICTRKVQDFEQLVSQIGNKNPNASASERAGQKEMSKVYQKQVLRLFIDGGKDVSIEVSSINNPTNSYPIATYLQRLANLSYASITMERSEVAYIGNFFPKRYDEDGYPIYTATATVCMKFTGKDHEGNVVYSDVTCKQIEVELRRRRVWGESEERDWSVLLGDISVTETSIGK